MAASLLPIMQGVGLGVRPGQNKNKRIYTYGLLFVLIPCGPNIDNLD